MKRLTIRTDICAEPENDIIYSNPNDPEGMYNILDLAECLYSGGEAEAGILLNISYRLAEYEDTGLSPAEVAELAQAEPVKHGKWKLYGNDDDSSMSYWCTVCNFQLSEDLFYSGYENGRWIENGVFKYCPNCGAKMEVEP